MSILPSLSSESRRRRRRLCGLGGPRERWGLGNASAIFLANWAPKDGGWGNGVEAAEEVKDGQEVSVMNLWKGGCINSLREWQTWQTSPGGKCSVCTETNACPACIACQQTGTIQNLWRKVLETDLVVITMEKKTTRFQPYGCLGHLRRQLRIWGKRGEALTPRSGSRNSSPRQFAPGFVAGCFGSNVGHLPLWSYI